MAEYEAWVMIPKLNKDKEGCVLDMHPFVLCKDCVYRRHDGYCEYNCWGERKPDWYCADGKREGD